MSRKETILPKDSTICHFVLIKDKIIRTAGFFYVTIVTVVSILPNIQSVVWFRSNKTGSLG
jgi:hypothetical protein